MYSMDSMLVHYVNNVCSFSSGLLDRISELSTINLHLIGELVCSMGDIYVWSYDICTCTSTPNVHASPHATAQT